MIKWKQLLTRIPNTVKFGKTTYEVLWVDAFTNEKTLGETRFDTKQIIIKTGESAKETVHTYLHEIIHALENEYGANLTENQVLALEKGVKDILKKGNIFK
jgi:hypothetical protein